MNPDGGEGPLTYRAATVSPTAASQSIWPVEPAANGQDNQLMRILSYESAIVKAWFERLLAKIERFHVCGGNGGGMVGKLLIR
jgi:hypothetical protein